MLFWYFRISRSATVPGRYRRFLAGASRSAAEFRPAFGGGGEQSMPRLTRQYARISRLEERAPHTLPRWPCARRTTITAVIVITTVVSAAAAATATSTTAPSRRGLLSARGLTRRLRFRDLDALRRGRRRVWMFGGSGRLFSFLFSLNCLGHYENFLEGEWGKGRKERGRDRSVGMFDSEHVETTRP